MRYEYSSRSHRAIYGRGYLMALLGRKNTFPYGEGYYMFASAWNDGYRHGEEDAASAKKVKDFQKLLSTALDRLKIFDKLPKSKNE